MDASGLSELAAPEDGRAPPWSILANMPRATGGIVGSDTKAERARPRAQQRESADKPWKTWTRQGCRSLLRPRTGALHRGLSWPTCRELPGGLWDLTQRRSAPVPGRSNVKARISPGKHGRVRAVGACCARGRARSTVVYPGQHAASYRGD